jgi:hypothetical protein
LVGCSERGIYVINYLRLSEILDLLEGIAGESREVLREPQG